MVLLLPPLLVDESDPDCPELPLLTIPLGLDPELLFLASFEGVDDPDPPLLEVVK